MMKAASVRATILCATGLAMLHAAPAFAQSSGAAVGNDSDTIVVTARRVEERAQDVPISITTFSPQQIQDRNIVSTTDLATYTPSLQVNSKYGPDKASFIIRGFSQDQNTAPTVAVYFADVVAPRLQSNIGGGNGAGPGSLFDLQNIQVLKGPQGTLFGRNTTGGAILLVPKKPNDNFEGYVEGTYGNHNERRVQAALNLPLSDTFKVRMGFDRNARDGYLHNRSGVGPDDFDDVNYTAARLSIVADLTPDLENYLIASYVHSDTNGGLPKFVYCNDGQHPNADGTPSTGSSGIAALLRPGCVAQLARDAGYGKYDVENNDPTPFVRSTTWQVIDTTTWKASDTLTVKNIVSYSQATESYSFSLDGDNTTIPFVIVRPGPHTGEGSESTFTEEFQLQGRTSNDRFTWQAGGYTELSSPLGGQEQYVQTFATCANSAAAYAFTCTAPLGSGSSMTQTKNTYKFQNYAAYAQASYKFTDTLSLTGGIRETWDWEREYSDNVRIGVSPTGPTSFTCSRGTTPVGGANASLLTNGACLRHDPATETINPATGLLDPTSGEPFTAKSARPTWLIDLDYKPSRDLLVYLKYARGYRAGGVNEANLTDEVWKPEKVDDYEVGVKSSFHGALSGTFDIDGFWNNFSNQQTAVSIPGCTATNNPTCTAPATGISGIQNIGRSRMRGAEVEGSLSYSVFRLDFGYSYLQAKVISTSTPTCGAPQSYDCANAAFLVPGSTLPFAPKNRITLTGTFTLPVDASVGKISASVTFSHTDKQFVTNSNTSAFVAGAIPFDAGTAPKTDLVNLAVNWRNVLGKPIDVSFFATNLTNQYYYVANANALSTLGGESVALGEPRMYGVRLRYSFGS